MQPGDIGLETILLLQVDVEAGKVQEIEIEVLGGGIVDVGDQRLRVLGLSHIVETLDEALDFFPAVPAHDRGRDLVADGVGEDPGMAGTGPHPLPLDDGGCQLPVVEEGDMLLPGQADHDPQAVLLSDIEEPARRYGVGAHRVDIVGCNLGEIAIYNFRTMIFTIIFVRFEGAIGYSSYIKLLGPSKKEFPLDFWTVGDLCGR